jgi:hypothetical protein
MPSEYECMINRKKSVLLLYEKALCVEKFSRVSHVTCT